MKKRILFALCATAAVAWAQTTPNIDDFEDGDGLANTGADDAWYAYTDKNDKGASTYSNTSDQYGTVVVIAEAAAGGSTHGAGLTGISLNKGSNANDPYVVLGLNVAGGLSGCTAISYKYKGAAHNLKAVMDGDTDGDGDGVSDLTGWNRHFHAFSSSTDWANASVSVSQLKQASGWGTTATLNMANVVQLAWEVKGTASPNYLYIDDVNCAGYTPGSSSTTTPTTAVDIDDFEDGNALAEILGKEAYWYLYTAGGSYTNEKDPTTGGIDMIVKDGDNSYAAMKGISGITPGSDTLKPPTYTSVGMEVAFDVGKLAGCTAIKYDYKGSGHRMRSSVDGVKEKEGWEHIATNQAAAADWKTVTVSTMAQPDWVANTTGATLVNFSWAKVTRLTWVVDEKISDTNLGTELDIDNVKCVGTMGSSTTPNSSSSNDSNKANNNENGNEEKTDPSAIASVAAVSGLKATLQGNTLMVNVAKAGLVKVQVFDMMGHVIESHSESMAVGSFSHTFGPLSKGFYVVRVQQGSMAKTLRMQVR